MVIPRFEQRKSTKGSIFSGDELPDVYDSLTPCFVSCNAQLLVWTWEWRPGGCAMTPANISYQNIFFWYQVNGRSHLMLFWAMMVFRTGMGLKGQCLAIASGSVSAVTKTNIMKLVFSGRESCPLTMEIFGMKKSNKVLSSAWNMLYECKTP